jgi:IS1 family transposase
MAICRQTKEILAFELGNRGVGGAKKLWEKN